MGVPHDWASRATAHAGLITVPCPETIDAQHGSPTWSGRCPYCRAVIARKRQSARQYEQRPNDRELDRLLHVRPRSGAVDELGRHINDW